MQATGLGWHHIQDSIPWPSLLHLHRLGHSPAPLSTHHRPRCRLQLQLELLKSSRLPPPACPGMCMVRVHTSNACTDSMVIIKLRSNSKITAKSVQTFFVKHLICRSNVWQAKILLLTLSVSLSIFLQCRKPSQAKWVSKFGILKRDNQADCVCG